MLEIFPFGQPVKKVTQKNRSPKQVFILGVYASAVHARWIGRDNKTIVRALAVDSEPCIFWRGDNAEEIINKISIPSQLGKLVPADKRFNGPSGIALDNQILSPLGLGRKDVWLCDLVPHSCMNSGQEKAIKREYLPRQKEFNLPVPSISMLPSKLTDAKRREEILDEIEESKSDILILLGDKPIQYFLHYFDNRWKRLSDFSHYGKLYKADIGVRKIMVLPLAHPRQIAKLGRSSIRWFKAHQNWQNQEAKRILTDNF